MDMVYLVFPFVKFTLLQLTKSSKWGILTRPTRSGFDAERALFKGK